MDVSKIIIANIQPEPKDHERVKGFEYNTSFGRCSFYGNGAPSATGAKRMAKAIKDPIKLVRRSKAVVAKWGIDIHIGYSGGNPVKEDIWAPFYDQLRNLGFSWNQINEITNYRTNE
jgi:hypothetical protein